LKFHGCYFLPVWCAVLGMMGRAYAQLPDQVGIDAQGRTILPTHQAIRPLGDRAQFMGRPVDLVSSPDGKRLYVKDNRGIVVIDTSRWKVTQELKLEGGTSLHGIAVSADGRRVFVTNAQSELAEAEIGPGAELVWKRRIPLPSNTGPSYPCGIALLPGGERALVCLSRDNSLAVVDLAGGKLVTTIPVGVAPWDVALSADGRTAYVSNWGGRKPALGEAVAPSAGTATLIDGRGVARSGSVSFVDLKTENEVTQVETGLHPSTLVRNAADTRLYVANANSDTVSVIDTIHRRLAQTISVHLNAQLPYGSAPTGLALSRDERTLYVAVGGNNAVAVVSLARVGQRDAVLGLIPADWYPGAVLVNAKSLMIANVKGLGSRERGKEKGYNVSQYTGTVTRVPLPTNAELRLYTARAVADSRIPEILYALRLVPARVTPARRRGRAASIAASTAARHRAIPGYYRHLVYIIKENRTYDQLLGDLKQGNGDPDLCLFGRDVTPNHHALAEQFVLLDNFYCNGVLSADGHSWATEGNVTDHLEKAFGGFTRSYTFGDDPLTYSSSGFIWDDFLVHGLTFTNYGEMDYATPTPKADFATIYRDFIAGGHKFGFAHNIGIESLRRHSNPDYPGWNLSIPDVVRADIFLKDLHRIEMKGELSNFTIVYLPSDHTGADVSARSYLADNDLALGRIVAGISHSRFWATTCVFVIEDDPQSGFDHVDGHRSICLIASPYVKHGVTLHDFYNQTSVLHTMESMFGLPPMNQLDAAAPLMGACFNNAPDLRPYTAVPNTVPLVETRQALRTLRRHSAFWQKLAGKVRFDRPDASDDDALNRILWHAVRGEKTPYPEQFADKTEP
jgi:YVTN family beta-propeller protein